MQSNGEFFYARELAELYGISKQTLIFYDNKDIFKPAILDENGYRMYSFKQFFILGIILDLKNMGIKLHDINTIINERNPNNILNLLNTQLIKLHKQIETTQALCNKIKKQIDIIETYDKYHLNEVTLSYRETEKLLISPNIDFSLSQKQRLIRAAKFLNNSVKECCKNECPLTGFIFKYENLGTVPDSYNIFCQASQEHFNYIKNYDLYVQISVKSNFYDALLVAQPEIDRFCNALNLKGYVTTNSW